MTLQDSQQSLRSLRAPKYVAISPRRVFAMLLRHWYVLSSSWPRLLDLMYWPAVQIDRKSVV